MTRPASWICLILLACGLSASAQPTAFTYQGCLTEGGISATGACLITAQLFDHPTNAAAAVTGRLTNLVETTDGTFTLVLDFGAGVFDGRELWLELGVARPAGLFPTFTRLQPRQPVRSAPYAIRSAGVPDGAVTRAKLAAGAVQTAHLAPGAVGNAQLASAAVRGTNLADGAITGSQLAVGAAFSNLLAGSQGAVAARGVLLSPDPDNAALLQAGYVKLGSPIETGGGWTAAAEGTVIEVVAQGRSDHSAVWTGSEMIIWGGDNGSRLRNGLRYNPTLNTWQPMSNTNAPAAPLRPAAFWTGSLLLTWDTYFGGGGRYHPATDTWQPMSTEDVLMLDTAIGAENDYTLAWAGQRLVAWGTKTTTLFGQQVIFTVGRRYDPTTDIWSRSSTNGAPDPLALRTAVSINSKVCYWGGSEGALYDPVADTWSPMRTNDAPSWRRGHAGVWTGTTVAIMGGEDIDGRDHTDGGLYDPFNDRWSRIPSNAALADLDPDERKAVAVGNRVLIWGGHPTNWLVFNLANNSWSLMATNGAPVARHNFSAISTGSRLLVWGGETSGDDYLDSGGQYDPINNQWSGMAVPPSAFESVPRSQATAVWTGREVLLWGGQLGGQTVRTGFRYSPGLNQWHALPTRGSPTARTGHTAVWTGSAMLVWGGSDATAAEAGGMYRRDLDGWSSLPTENAPSPRHEHTAVWTGREMIVWGGTAVLPRGFLDFLADGGRFDPQTQTWHPINTNGAPVGRVGHTAVWTGTEMIVWGGYGRTGEWLGDGARYDPVQNRWHPLRSTGAPTARRNHTAVWTGQEMIVWGGDEGTNYLRSGAAYRPSDQTWTPLPLDGAPEGRHEHLAVFDGVAMLVWGGADAHLLHSGAAYDCFRHTWTELPRPSAPPPALNSVAVWTGEEWIAGTGQTASGYSAVLHRYQPSRRLYPYLKP